MAGIPYGISGVVYAYFATFRGDGQRAFSVERFLVLGILPVAAGVGLMLLRRTATWATLGWTAALMAGTAAVLTATLPLTHIAAGQTRAPGRREEGDPLLLGRTIERVQALQDFHAAICWAVLLLVAGLLCCGLCLLLPGGHFVDRVTWYEAVGRPLLAVLYAVLVAVVLALLDAARGIFGGMESHCDAVKMSIEEKARGAGEAQGRP